MEAPAQGQVRLPTPPPIRSMQGGGSTVITATYPFSMKTEKSSKVKIQEDTPEPGSGATRQLATQAQG